MSDRELLELAAKAAGYDIDFDDFLDCGSYKTYKDRRTGAWWNPIYDSGAAFRLAVKLQFEIRPGSKTITVAGDGVWEEVETVDVSRGEATRRAIVRAAAEIGRAA